MSSRDGDLDDFFSHENQGSPPSLSDCGRIRSGSKCDLIQCMDKLVGTEESPNPSVVVFEVHSAFRCSIHNSVKLSWNTARRSFCLTSNGQLKTYRGWI